MFTASEPARNEFVDPPPQDQSSARLVLGKERIECRLTEVSLGGFCVVVPRATMWAGEPVGRLVTHDAVYRVRILLQEAVYDGFLITLQRLSEHVDDLRPASRWIVHVSRCCAVGLLAAIGYGLLGTPGGISHGPAHHLTLQRIGWNLFNWSSAARPVVASQSSLSKASADTEPSDDVEEFETMPAISVSWGTRSEPVSDEARPENRVEDRFSLLKAAIDSAGSQRSRPVNATTLPWLFTMKERIFPLRMTGAAGDDLKQFEMGLRSLPAIAASDAVRSLRDALLAIGTSPKRISAVASLPGVKLIQSADAEIYFRSVDGEIELLRVLPIELVEGAPSRPRSAMATSPRAHR
jgi:hypothetical protein